MLVAVRHRGGHLAEEGGGLGLREAATPAHQAVHVPMGSQEKGIKVLCAHQDLRRLCHMPVGGQPRVRLQHSKGISDLVYLWAEHGVSTGRKLHGAQADLDNSHSQPFGHYCVLGTVPNASAASHSTLTKLRGHIASKYS